MNHPIQGNDSKCDLEGDDSIQVFETPIDPSPSEKTHDVHAQNDKGLESRED